jgi:hypothetical protein
MTTALRLRDKETGLIYDRVLEIEESSDDGDEYDYSPSREEWRLTSRRASMNLRLRMKAGRAGRLSAIESPFRRIWPNARRASETATSTLNLKLR